MDKWWWCGGREGGREVSGGVSKKVGGGLVIGIVRERFCVGDMGLHVIKTTSPFVGLPHYTTASFIFLYSYHTKYKFSWIKSHISVSVILFSLFFFVCCIDSVLIYVHNGNLTRSIY